MKKRALFVAIILCAFVVGAVFAYFNSKKTAVIWQSSTGRFDVTIEPQSLTEPGNILPGETREIKWLVRNDGSAPVFLKGKLLSEFIETGLNPSMLEVISVWRETNTDVWQQLHLSDSNKEFYASQDGTENNLLALLPGDGNYYKAVIKLKEEAGSEYQNSEFKTNVILGIKQTDQNAPWPNISE